MNEGKVSVQWLDKRPSRRKRFIDRIFSSLEEFTNEFISKTDGEMPFGYGERTQVGHLAQVAYKCGYFTVQDYDVSLGKETRRRGIDRTCTFGFQNEEGKHTPAVSK